jgi:hypothetical protein
MWGLVIHSLKMLEQFADGKARMVDTSDEKRSFVVQTIKMLIAFFSRFFPQERPSQMHLMTSNKLLNTM